MKCLTNNQIQQLLDGETPCVLSEKQHQHMDACPQCLERYNQQIELAQTVIELINASAQSPERIPEFRIPKEQILPTRKIRRIPGWLEMAALLIPIFFVWKMTYNTEEELKPTAENIRMIEKCNTIYANSATWRDNVIIIAGVDGIKVQYGDK